jgi:type IV secretory pathway TraG/TraD family ATPase VirD4
MGRGKGIHAVFGTQGLAELKQIEPVFMEQILNCVNTLICHRVNDSVSAQAVSDWIGTQNAFAVTAQLDIKQTSGGMGSVRSTKEYIVHPDSIKQELEVGEAYYITKVSGFRTDKVKVKFS